MALVKNIAMPTHRGEKIFTKFYLVHLLIFQWIHKKLETETFDALTILTNNYLNIFTKLLKYFA